MLQFKHRDEDTVFCFCFGSHLSSSTSSLESPPGGFFKISRRKSEQVSFISKQAYSQLGFHAIYGGRTILRFSFISWFPSPIPDLYEVAPSSTLLPILCLPPPLEVSRVAPIHSLLPIHCLPPSLTSTRVLIGRVSSDQVSLFLVLV